MSKAEYLHKLSEKLEWPHTLNEWEIMCQNSTVFTVSQNDRVQASALLTHYKIGSSLGMVLVDPNFGRQGLGTRVTLQALSSALQTDHMPVFLTSSHEAKGLYQKIGFNQAGSVVVLDRSSDTKEMNTSENNITCSAREIAEKYYDGCLQREIILEGFISDKNNITVCLRGNNGDIKAFASSVRRGGSDNKAKLAIGPVVGENPILVGNLVDRLLARTSLATTAFLFQSFSDEDNATKTARTDLTQEFKKRGFEKTDELPFMVYGNTIPKQFLSSRIVSPMTLAFS